MSREFVIMSLFRPSLPASGQGEEVPLRALTRKDLDELNRAGAKEQGQEDIRVKAGDNPLTTDNVQLDKKNLVVSENGDDGAVSPEQNGLEERIQEMNISATPSPPPPLPPILKKKKPPPTSKENPWTIVQKTLEEWFTVDTLRMVSGDEHVANMMRENNCSMEKVTSVLGDASLEPRLRARYIDLCRRLDIEESMGESESEQLSIHHHVSRDIQFRPARHLVLH